MTKCGSYLRIRYALRTYVFVLLWSIINPNIIFLLKKKKAWFTQQRFPKTPLMSEYFGVKLVSSTHISVGAIKVIDLIDWGGRRWCCIYARGTNYKTSCVLTCANPNEPHYSTPGICLGTLTNNKTSGMRLQFAKLMRHSYMQRGTSAGVTPWPFVRVAS